MSEAPKINCDVMVKDPVDRIQVLEKALYDLAEIIDAQREPDIDLMHDIIRNALRVR